MRRVIVSEFMTLDGVVESPDWSAPFWNEQIATYKFDELFACDALLLGRVTYERFARLWPSAGQAAAMEQAFADLPLPGAFCERMNEIPKLVASHQPLSVAWSHASRIEGDVAEQVAALRQQPGKPLLVVGSPTLVADLLRCRLIDDLHLLIFPLLLGRGRRLFDGEPSSCLRLHRSQQLGPDVVHLHYRAPRR